MSCLTQSEIARRVGASQPAIHKAIRSGRMPPLDRIASLDEAEGLWDAQRDPGKTARARAEDESYGESRARLVRVKAEREELKLEAERGTLVEAARVHMVGGELAEAVKRALDSAADDVVAAVREAKSAAEAKRAWSRAVLALHKAIADEVDRRCAALGSHGDG
jgi:transcriptional regulator with XRE-family HTH domain